MIQLSYDGTFSGLFTVIFEIYERKIPDAVIIKQSEIEALSFSGDIFIATDKEKSKRVWKGLVKKVSKQSLKNIYWCFLSEVKGIENTILDFCRSAFSSDINIETDFGNASVLIIAQTAKKVGREKHRFEAFIRFEKISADLFYASADPDFNILPLILPHFKRRYADQNWIIYDTKRKYGIHYDQLTENVNEVIIDFTASADRTETEILIDHEDEKYQHLWKNYFKSVNIPARKNTKLHLKHIPKRYWKYLTEKKINL